MGCINSYCLGYCRKKRSMTFDGRMQQPWFISEENEYDELFLLRRVSPIVFPSLPNTNFSGKNEVKMNPADTSSSIPHRFDIEIPHQHSVDTLSIMKCVTTSKEWHWFNLYNSTSIWLSKSMKYRRVLRLAFSMSLCYPINAISGWASWLKTHAFFHFFFNNIFYTSNLFCDKFYFVFK